MSSSSITIRYKKDVAENYHRNLKYNNKKNTTKRKYFLFCADCFWMASTLLINLSDNNPSYFKKCPKCNNLLDKFPIPNHY
jgi:hypothetical protein